MPRRCNDEPTERQGGGVFDPQVDSATGRRLSPESPRAGAGWWTEWCASQKLLTTEVPQTQGATEMTCEPRPQRKRKETPDSTAETVGRRVLVVDDQRNILDLIARLLRRRGYDVRTAPDGWSALEQAVSFRPAVVLADIGLPGMDGLELAKRLRNEPALQGTRLVALTGYDGEEMRRQIRDAGFDHHLTKPPTIAELNSL